MRKILIKIQVVQVKKTKGMGFKRYRINPYNPLSYIALPLLFIAAVVMFGVVGMWREVDCRNPFKWH